MLSEGRYEGPATESCLLADADADSRVSVATSVAYASPIIKRAIAVGTRSVTLIGPVSMESITLGRSSAAIGQISGLAIASAAAGEAAGEVSVLVRGH